MESDLDLRRIAQMIKLGSIPEELEMSDSSTILVSTVHRAKGLEFDRAIIIDDRNQDDRNIAEENRVRYVALTRAREEIFVLEALRPADGWLTMRGRRWCVAKGRTAGAYLRYVEIVGSDSNPEYLEGLGNDPPRVLEVQEKIAASIRRGDPLNMKRIIGDLLIFDIYWKDVRVGRTTERFGDELHRIVGRQAVKVDQISGARVEGLDTVSGDPALGKQGGLGTLGIWLRVRPMGLGRLEFQERKSSLG